MPFETNNMSSRTALDSDDELIDVSDSNGIVPSFRAISPRSVTPVNSPHPQYEEFFGGNVNCPTCRGTGKIPRDRENELVALIPMSDKRLKPRRTTYYVMLAVLICLIIGGLTTFFMFPRGVRLLSDGPVLSPTYLYVNTSEEMLNMTIVNEYNISNSNYYGVSIENLTMMINFDQRILATAVNHTQVMVPIRSTQRYHVRINITFDGDEGYIAYYCKSDIRRSHTLLLPFQATLKTKYFGGVMETTLMTYQHVRCTSKSEHGH